MQRIAVDENSRSVKAGTALQVNQTCAEVKARTEQHLADVRAKIADLQRIERVLTTTAASCADDDAPDCPIIAALAS